MSRMITLTACLCLTLSACDEIPCEDRPGEDVVCDGQAANQQDAGTTKTDTAIPDVQGKTCVSVVECGSGYQCIHGFCLVDYCVHGFKMDTNGACQKVQPVCPDTTSQNPCVILSCNPETGELVENHKTCDDGRTETEDTCDSKTGDCNHIVRCQNCANENPCDKDMCNFETGECEHEPVVCPTGYACMEGTCQKHCAASADCADDNDCTIDSCTVATGQCVNEMHDCKDDDETTLDQCIVDANSPQGYTCEHLATACTGGCDDQNPCTADSCNDDGTCLRQDLNKVFCGLGTVCEAEGAEGKCVPAPCEGATDCVDNNPCTEKRCEFGACVFAPKPCPEGQVCNVAVGECVDDDAASCPGGCEAGEVCQAGVCIRGITCGAGTVLDENTFQCVPGEFATDGCTNGTRTCRQFEATRMHVYAICQGTNWIALETCGPIGGLRTCVADVGCITP